MNATIETLETLRTPFADITPVVWRDRDMCGLASVRVVPTCPMTWWLSAIAMAVSK